MNNFEETNFLFRQIIFRIQLKFSFSKRRRDDLNIRMIIIIIKSKLSKVSFQYSIRLSII